MIFTKLLNKGYQTDQCQICRLQFGVLKLQRPHQCKRCKRCICAKCGKEKAKILQKEGLWSQQAHRVCKTCKDDVQLIKRTIDKYQLNWNRRSTFSKKWIETITSKDYDYQHFLKLFYKNQHNYSDEIEIIQKDVILGRTDYNVFNFSLKQFMHLVQNHNGKSSIRNNIANVLYAIAAKFDRIGYCQGMSGVIAFLLCFSDQHQCFQIYCDLLQHIYPPNFFAKSNFGVTLIGLLAEISFLQQYFIQILQTRRNLIAHFRQPYNQSQIQRFRTIIQLSATKCFLSLFINTLSFSNLLFIWQQLAQKKSFDVIQKAFLAIIYMSRQQVLQIKSFQYLQSFFQNIDQQTFIDTYYDFDINQQSRKLLLDKYYQGLSNKWTNSSNANIKNLTKVTNFSQNQIKFLQNQFVSEDGIIINKQQYLQLMRIYSQKQKQIHPSRKSVFNLSHYYLGKIYDSYNTLNRNGLDFRQFVCCLSNSCRGTPKQRLCAIVNTFEDKTNSISRQLFDKLIHNLCQLTPQDLIDQAQRFKKRMKGYFHNQSKISVNEIYILLNDQFIGELTLHTVHQSSNVLQQSVHEYLRIKKNKV